MSLTYFHDVLNIIPRVALRWNPQEIRRQGRPKASGLRIVEKEIKAIDLTLGEAEIYATDRICWRQRVDYSPGGAKNKMKKHMLTRFIIVFSEI